ncbi:MAG: DUF3995 domain-containing protein [Thermoanaerobaculia bacterium]
MAITVALVLAVLALLHVYWGVVGIGGRSVALPEVEGKPLFIPSRAATFAVAAGLSAAALLLLWRGGYLPLLLPPQVTKVGTLGVGLLFVARAIGDFRFVGLFKRVRGTPFAIWDSRLFSPLSLAIGLGSLWVAYR